MPRSTAAPLQSGTRCHRWARIALVQILFWPAAHAARGGPMQECSPMPKLVHSEVPDFPARESRTAPGGTVTLAFTINEDGTVTDPVVIDSKTVPTNNWFNETALRSILRWRFSSVRKACRGRQAITFRLTD